MLRRIATSLVCAAILATAAPAIASEMPGNGRTIKMARATWDTGWFQAAIYKDALQALGYDVGRLITLNNAAFYQAVSQGDVDLWVNGWFPLHDSYRSTFAPAAKPVGYVAKGGALQGYLIDKRTADKYHITNLDDLRKPKIRELFDDNGDGKADMVACPPGWGCEKQIDEDLKKYHLQNVIEPIKASYSASMADAVGRYKAGKSILFYTWTPNWTVGVLKPGKDVVWIEVPDATPKTTIANVKGCVANPCKMGWPANDIRPVANVAFLKKNPAVKKLLEVARIPLKDIFAQNAKMNAGADSDRDIARQAKDWITSHRALFDGWIEQAKRAAKK